MTASGPELLTTYLNDHLAGSMGAIELVRRAAREHEGTELGAFLSRLAREIEEDRQALRRVMAAAGAGTQHEKLVLAWVAEKVGRLKLNERLLHRSPLSPFIELETLEVGIYGKQLLWQALREHRPPGSEAVDPDELIARAERQRAEIEEHRLVAAAALIRTA
jgi:hypothetical protein